MKKENTTSQDQKIQGTVINKDEVVNKENIVNQDSSIGNADKILVNDKETHQPIPLSLESIYKDKQFKANKMDSIRWLKDASGYTVLEDSDYKLSKLNEEKNSKKEESKKFKDIVVYNSEDLERKVLILAKELIPQGKKEPLEIDDYIWSDDRSKVLIYTNSKKVWRSNSRGDYWVFDMKSRNLKAIGEKSSKASQLMFAKFSSDATKVGYVYHNNVYVQDLKTFKVQQLTHDASDTIVNGLFDWVYEEEFAIKDGFRWSPDGTKIAYWQLDTEGSRDFIMINNTDDIYPKLTRFPYPKVGETNAAARVGIVTLSDLKTTWMSLPGNPRNRYVPRMDWASNNDQIVIQQMNRKQDRNFVYLADAKTGNANLILTEEEETFIDNVTDMRWIEDGQAFLWESERSGWNHIYRVSRDGKNIFDLTPGEFDVIKVQVIDEKNGYVYFIASPENASQRYLYRAPINSSVNSKQDKNLERITPVKFVGTNNYQISPDGSWAIHTYSNFHTPKEKHLVSIPEHKQFHQMLNNDELKQKLSNIDRNNTEFFQVEARDGLVLDGYIIRPKDFNPNKKYPVIFYVYGWPGGQTVKDVWQGNKYLWGQLMTEKGFLVVSIDNRGTGVPKGREWRKSIYGGVGIISSRDQYDALQAIGNRWPYIDMQKIGVWGHSGGGSMTLDLMFRYPDSYHVGVSRAPVTDQKLYDTIYQERYSGLLEDHAEGYKQGSAITHAKNLKGKLLLVHGTGDDNVHYQNSEMLINELVKHNKQFDFMSYPNRSHSIREGQGTTLHLQTMMTEYFEKHLLRK